MKTFRFRIYQRLTVNRWAPARDLRAQAEDFRGALRLVSALIKGKFIFDYLGEGEIR